jgi:hypothetical protein
MARAAADKHVDKEAASHSGVVGVVDVICRRRDVISRRGLPLSPPHVTALSEKIIYEALVLWVRECPVYPVEGYQGLVISGERVISD